MLVVHVPPASLAIPSEVQIIISLDMNEAKALTSADLLTDNMAKAAWPDVTIICADVSCIVVGVERYANDVRQ